jgi:parallel beta-helix repeat protein
MKICDRLFVAVLVILFVTASGYATLVDGNCYLEGENDHSGTKVLFVEISPTAETDSVYTGTSGDYQLDVAPGLYDVFFTHDGFYGDEIIGQNCFDPITLPAVTLLSTEGELSGAISGVLAAGEYLVVGDLSIIDGESLTIEPGATLLFDGTYSFTIESNRTLICQGTETDSIKFMPNYDGGITEWEGIDLSNSGSDDILEFSLITGSTSQGIHCSSSSPTINNCTISGNSAEREGGGIYCSESDPTISNCTISGNLAGISGGGIELYDSDPTISNCTISGNTIFGSDGGGIFCYHSSPTFSNCTITGNSANQCGGGIGFCQSNSTISNCTITGNSAEWDGGGIWDISSSLTISNCTITGNSAERNGGGIHCLDSSPTVSNCTITGNSAQDENDGYGGGFCCEHDESSPTIINCAVTNNEGAGIYVFSGSLEITYCDVYDNDLGDFDGDGINPYLGVLVTTNANGDPCDAWMNILLDPMYVDPNTGDYHFQETSPCIDAGDPLSPLDPDGTVADIGAFYFNQLSVSDFTGIELPASYGISPAYPNPFNPTTTVSVSLPSPSELNVSVFNINGQQVATLASGPYSSGYHTLTFDASSLASGLFFVRATVPGHMDQTQKIMLVR